MMFRRKFRRASTRIHVFVSPGFREDDERTRIYTGMTYFSVLSGHASLPERSGILKS